MKPRREISFRGEGDIAILEGRFEKSFVGGFPVVVGSARVGIMLILKLFHLSQLISIFPFASQCIVKAAVLAGKSVHTPLPNESREIIYNQWGLHQNHGIHPSIFLEDSADSLYPIGGRVCKANSRFEVWSFPKILGTSFGGVVWCRTKSDAQRLRKVRNSLPQQNFIYQTLLSMTKSTSKTGYQIWENYEFSHPTLNKFQVKILNAKLDTWPDRYSNMRRIYDEALRKAENTNYPKERDLDTNNCGVIPTVVEWDSVVKNHLVRKLTRVYSNGNLEQKNVFAYQKTVSAI